MRLICPECKNEVDLSIYPQIKPKQVVQCNHCGMVLSIVEIKDDGEVITEIVDEGK